MEKNRIGTRQEQEQQLMLQYEEMMQDAIASDKYGEGQ